MFTNYLEQIEPFKTIMSPPQKKLQSYGIWLWETEMRITILVRAESHRLRIGSGAKTESVGSLVQN